MGRSKKFDYQAAIQSSLIAHPDGLTLDELLERSGFQVDRSTLFRHLARLIQAGGVERVGKARASRYRPLPITAVRDASHPHYTPRPALAPERSAENYPPVRVEPDSVPQPDRLAPPDNVADFTSAHRAVIKKAVCTVVREWKRCNRINLQIYLSLMAEPEHLDALTAAVEARLAGLHAGDLAEFGLTEDEFRRFIPQ